jgi:hypothetical protein
MVFLAKLLFFSINPLFSLNPFPINNNPTKWVIPINKIGLGKYYLTQTSNNNENPLDWFNMHGITTNNNKIGDNSCNGPSMTIKQSCLQMGCLPLVTNVDCLHIFKSFLKHNDIVNLVFTKVFNFVGGNWTSKHASFRSL